MDPRDGYVFSFTNTNEYKIKVNEILNENEEMKNLIQEINENIYMFNLNELGNHFIEFYVREYIKTYYSRINIDKKVIKDIFAVNLSDEHVDVIEEDFPEKEQFATMYKDKKVYIEDNNIFAFVNSKYTNIGRIFPNDSKIHLTFLGRNYAVLLKKEFRNIF